MCVNYQPPNPEQFHASIGATGPVPAEWAWPAETWKDYLAPIVRAHAGGRIEAVVGSYGMVPQHRIADGSRFDTMNARAETLHERRAFAGAWQLLQLCAVPMWCFYEPCYESGRAVRHGIGMHDGSLFWAAGLWRDWPGSDGARDTSFTQITINAETHPLMRRMHKPGDEKRTLVLLGQHAVRDWLRCRTLEQATAMLRHFPAEQMKAWPQPLGGAAAINGELF